MESYESKLITDVEREVQLRRHLKLHEVPDKPLEPIRWGKIMSEQPSRFIRPDGSLIVETLRNFKRVQLLLANDDPQKPSLKTLIGGVRPSGSNRRPRRIAPRLRWPLRDERGHGLMTKGMRQYRLRDQHGTFQDMIQDRELIFLSPNITRAMISDYYQCDVQLFRESAALIDYLKQRYPGRPRVSVFAHGPLQMDRQCLAPAMAVST